MFVLAQECCVSGLWAVCKSQRLGGRQHHFLIPQMFSQLFLSLLVHKEMLTTHTQRHIHMESLQTIIWVHWMKCQPPDTASHCRKDLRGRWRDAPLQQLEARWLFHVFMSHWRSIKFDHHSLRPILHVCVCLCSLKETKPHAYIHHYKASILISSAPQFQCSPHNASIFFVGQYISSLPVGTKIIFLTGRDFFSWHIFDK